MTWHNFRLQFKLKVKFFPFLEWVGAMWVKRYAIWEERWVTMSGARFKVNCPGLKSWTGSQINQQAQQYLTENKKLSIQVKIKWGFSIIDHLNTVFVYKNVDSETSLTVSDSQQSFKPTAGICITSLSHYSNIRNSLSRPTQTPWIDTHLAQYIQSIQPIRHIHW